MEDIKWLEEVELDAALAAYRSAAPRGLWQALRRLTRLLAPLGVLARGIARISKPSRDVQAILPTLAYLRALTHPR